MSTEGFIVVMLILAMGIVVLALPFRRRRDVNAPGNAPLMEQEREALLAGYERVLSAIRDIDEDYQLGKLPQDAYTELREHWAERGAATLEALELLGESKPKRKPKDDMTAPDADAVLDDAIEQAIARYANAKSNAGG